MEHFFELPVLINGEEQSFNGRLATFGYSYKLYIVVNGKELVFEKDDEQQYRVLSEQSETNVDEEMLTAIIASLKKLA
jgi:hypothetical protein